VYREQAPGAPSNDPLFVEPGKGLRGIWVGRATPDDVLRVFGDDCHIARYDSGEVFQIVYLYGADGKADPHRPEQRTFPSQFGFEFGLLDEIHVGPSQDQVHTTGGLRYKSPLAEVLRVLGEPDARIGGGKSETLRYMSLGIDVDIWLEDETLSSFKIFRARR
jgi:hypothetical protein